MPNTKKFLDPAGVGHLWERITTELNAKANVNDLANVATSGAAIDVDLIDSGDYFYNKNVEGALQQLGLDMQTVGDVSILEDDGSGSILKVYTIMQRGNIIGTINIPKDMVAISGAIVNQDENGQSGVFLRLVIANSDPIYVDVASLIEYNSVTDSNEIAFTDYNHQISGELKFNSVSKAKLDYEVQDSLDLADSALQPEDITTGATVGAIAVQGTDIPVYGFDTALNAIDDALAVKADRSELPTNTSELINDSDFVIKHYAVCNTPAATPLKQINLANLENITTGLTITVKFIESNTAEYAQLCINNDSTIDIYRGETAIGLTPYTSWPAGAVVTLTYDGQYWQINDWDIHPVTSVNGQLGDVQIDAVEYNGAQELTEQQQKNVLASLGLSDEGIIMHKEAYISKQIPYGNTEKIEQIIGGTIFWNQLCDGQPYSQSPGVDGGVTFTNNQDGSFTLSGGPAAGSKPSRFSLTSSGIFASIPKGHIMYMTLNCAEEPTTERFALSVLSTGDTVLLTDRNNEVGRLWRLSSTSEDNYSILCVRAWIGADFTNSPITIKPQLFDLTAMFGAEIADAIYTINQATPGAGVEWFRKLFPETYYPYNAGSFYNVQTSGRQILDTNNDIIKTYSLDNSLELHGVPKLDQDGKLYYDGDIYESNGTVSRRYQMVDLGTLSWSAYTTGGRTDVFRSSNALSGSKRSGQLFCIKYKNASGEDDSIFIHSQVARLYLRDADFDGYTGAQVREALSGVMLLYEVATPTIESAAPYKQYEEIVTDGREQFIDSRTPSMPVGVYAGYYEMFQGSIPRLDDKADKTDIPTSLSQLTNDVGYLSEYTETDPTVPAWAKANTKPSYTAAEVGAPTVQEMNTAIQNALSNISSLNMTIVQTLPSQDINTSTIYLVPKTSSTNNDIYDEYIYINNAWERIGSTQVDLTNYVQKTDYATDSVAGLVMVATVAETQAIINDYIPEGEGDEEDMIFNAHFQQGGSDNTGFITEDTMSTIMDNYQLGKHVVIHFISDENSLSYLFGGDGYFSVIGCLDEWTYQNNSQEKKLIFSDQYYSYGAGMQDPVELENGKIFFPIYID